MRKILILDSIHAREWNNTAAQLQQMFQTRPDYTEVIIRPCIAAQGTVQRKHRTADTVHMQLSTSTSSCLVYVVIQTEVEWNVPVIEEYLALRFACLRLA